MGWLEDPQVWLAAGIVFVAGLVRGFTGFGSAMIMSSSLSALFGPTSAIPLVILMESIVALPLLPGAVAHVDRKSLLKLCLFALPGLPLGFWILQNAPAEPIRWAISGLILGFLAILVFRRGTKGPIRGFKEPVAGFLSGITTTATGMSGPPVILLYLAGQTRAAAMRANLIAYFLFVDLLAILAFLALDRMGTLPIEAGLTLAVVFTVPALAGAKLFNHSSDEFYRAVAMGLVAAVAIVSLFV